MLSTVAKVCSKALTSLLSPAAAAAGGEAKKGKLTLVARKSERI